MSSFYNINESYLNWQEKNTSKKERKELRCSCISKIITFFYIFLWRKIRWCLIFKTNKQNYLNGKIIRWGNQNKLWAFFKKKIESEWISHKSFENFFAKNVKGVISIEIQFLNIKKKLRKSEKVKWITRH